VGKKFVCYCEDLTEEDLLKAIREGYNDVETLKRYAGFSTGPCQGKTCLLQVLRLLAAEKNLKPSDLHLTTQRAPVDPIPLGVLAGRKKKCES
jgi:NAD(P)H-nitrite reductase large subunit